MDIIHRPYSVKNIFFNKIVNACMSTNQFLYLKFHFILFFVYTSYFRAEVVFSYNSLNTNTEMRITRVEAL